MRHLKLAVYDFDGTIVPFETPNKIFWFVAFKKFWVIPFIPLVAIAYLLYLIKFLNETDVKNFILFFINKNDINNFWKKYKKSIFHWVPEQFEKDKKNGYKILIISASCENFLKAIAAQCGADFFIATPVNASGKKITGPNCKGKQKIIYLNKFAEKNNFSFDIVSMFSDSKNDLPLMLMAENSFWVKKNGDIFPFVKE